MSNCMTNFTFPPVPHCKVKMIKEKDTNHADFQFMMTNLKWASRAAYESLFSYFVYSPTLQYYNISH